MNILLVCEFGNLNGAERSLLTTIDRLRDTVQYSAIVPSFGELTDALKSRNIPIYPLDWKSGDKNRQLELIRHDFAEILKFYKARQGSEKFLVHANSLSTSRMTGPICQQQGVCSLGHIRDIIKLSKQVILDLNCHTKLVCVSSATRDFHLSQGLEKNKSTFLYNGVDLDRFYPNPSKVQNKPLKIGTAGQVSLRKGMDIFAKSAEILEQNGIQLQYEIAGSRQSSKQETVELEEYLIEFSKGFPNNRFRLIGQLPNLSDWLRDLDIYVHPARQEPLGRVILEAGATELPIIATDVGGTREILGNFITCKTKYSCIVQPNNPVTITNAIINLIKNPEVFTNLGRLARKQIVEKFSDSMAAKNLLLLYKSVIQH